MLKGLLLVCLLRNAQAFVISGPHQSARRLSTFHNENAQVEIKPGCLFQSASSSNDVAKSEVYQLEIEYCTGCKWGLRGFWLAQELLTTFSAEPKLGAVTLIPSRPSVNPPAVFRVKMTGGADGSTNLLWDRKEKGGFPEAKEIKQLVRDITNPALFLGHSDTTDKQEEQEKEGAVTNEVIDLSKEVPQRVDTTLSPSDIQNGPTPNVAITYCTGCRWLLRSAYFAQELTATFGEEINSLTLIPSRPPAKGGAFMVTVTLDVNTPTVVWDRANEGRFPETKELKQKIRDLLNPEKDLGHIDGSKKEEGTEEFPDDEAAEARQFFGVA